MNTKRPTHSYSFWLSRNLSNHMSSCTGDTVLVEIREITDRIQTVPLWLGGGREGVRRQKTKYIGPVAGDHPWEWPLLSSVWIFTFYLQGGHEVKLPLFDLRLTWPSRASCPSTWWPSTSPASWSWLCPGSPSGWTTRCSNISSPAHFVPQDFFQYLLLLATPLLMSPILYFWEMSEF